MDILCVVLYSDPYAGYGFDVESEGFQVRLAPLLKLRTRRLDLANLGLQVRDLTLLGGLLIEQNCDYDQGASEGGNVVQAGSLTYCFSRWRAR